VLTFLTALATGALAGLVSLPHCVAMCGPYAAFACAAGGPGSGTTARFLVGRAVGYSILGAIVGGSGSVVVGWLPPRWASVALAATLALGMLSLAWRLVRSPTPEAALVPLRRSRTSATPSAPAAPSGTDAAPTRASGLSRIRGSSGVLGALMALFPCGALYAALLVAAGTASAWTGAGAMLGFALSSSVALGASGWVARLSSTMDLHTRRVLGAALIVGAIVLVVRPLTSEPHQPAVCHTAGNAP
jgi:sulfite exporter TauE/SafE